MVGRSWRQEHGGHGDDKILQHGEQDISYRSASKRDREAAGLINSVYAGLTVPWRQVI